MNVMVAAKLTVQVFGVQVGLLGFHLEEPGVQLPPRTGLCCT